MKRSIHELSSYEKRQVADDLMLPTGVFGAALVAAWAFSAAGASTVPPGGLAGVQAAQTIAGAATAQAQFTGTFGG